MTEREGEQRDEQRSGELGDREFQDSGLSGEEELHASFEDLTAPVPDSDPFAEDGKDDEGEENRDAEAADAD